MWLLALCILDASQILEQILTGCLILMTRLAKTEESRDGLLLLIVLNESLEVVGELISQVCLLCNRRRLSKIQKGLELAHDV